MEQAPQVVTEVMDNFQTLLVLPFNGVEAAEVEFLAPARLDQGVRVVVVQREPLTVELETQAINLKAVAVVERQSLVRHPIIILQAAQAAQES